MPLKNVIASLDELPESLRAVASELYKEVPEGGFKLDAEAVASSGNAAEAALKKKTDEFRNNNIQLKKQLDELHHRIGDMTPEELASLRELKSKIDNNEAMQLVKEGKLDEVISKKTSQMKAQYDADMRKLNDQLKLISETNAKKTNRLSQLLLDTAIDAEVEKLGIPREGTRDIARRLARDKFTIDEAEQIVPITAEGDEQGQTLTPTTFVRGLLKSMPHLFEGSTGAGATGVRQSRTAVKRIPNDPEMKGRFAKEIAAGTVEVDNSMPLD